MLYYKVKKEYDNKPVNPYIKDDNFLVAGELITGAELKKLIKNGLIHYINYEKFFDVVNINKNKTYFFFGARYYET